MADYFFDTSAIVKHYHLEAGTARVRTLVSDAGSRKFLSRLAKVEIQATFAKNHATGPIILVCADQALCSIASGEGLAVMNPEVP